MGIGVREGSQEAESGYETTGMRVRGDLMRDVEDIGVGAKCLLLISVLHR
jgi:hypothetical protein